MYDILKLIHGYNIYENFKFQDYPTKVIGWNVCPELYRYLLRKLKPKLILEFGSWYGASAICIGNIIKELELSTQIICIDTWLGSYEFIGLHERDYDRQLFPRFGYPQAYYQFLANICHHNLQDIIIPFPQTIRLACKWLYNYEIYSDLIYVDGNNDFFDVYNDINEGWKILNHLGIIFGDDYNSPIWPTINLGLNRFCMDNLLKPNIIPEFPHYWTIQKINDN